MNYITIIHNTSHYKIEAKKLIGASGFFAKNYVTIKKTLLYEAHDLHSISAFDAFIKIINQEPTYILEKDVHQIESLLKEYEVASSYRKHFDDFVQGKIEKKFFLKALDGNFYSLVIKDNDSDEILRKKIFEVTNVPPEKQNLVVEGNTIHRVRDVLNYESRTIIMNDPSKPIKITVNFFDETTFIDIVGDEKVIKICDITADRLGGNVDIMVPMLGNRKLDKEKTLFDEGIANGDLLTIQTL